MGGLLRAGFAVATGAMAAMALGCATSGRGPGNNGEQAPGDDATAARDVGAGTDAPGAPPGDDGARASEASGDDGGPLDPDATLAGEEGTDDETPTDASSVTESDAPSSDLPHDTGAPVDAGDESAPPEAGPGGGGDSAFIDGAVDAALADASGEASAPCACGPHFACGASGYCQTTTGVPAFGHVFVIVLDNQPLSAIKGSTSAPYLNKLMSTYAYGTGYTTAFHPSLPNLIDLTSGNPQQIACDCAPGTTSTCNAVTCSLLAKTCACPVAVSHLGDELDVAQLPWREYAESMGAPCNPSGADGGALFAANHVPFLYYADVFGNNGRCVQRVRDYRDFAADLGSGSYRFSLISPNLCNDMHGGCGPDAVKPGDQWLAAQVPAILATPGFAAGGSDALFIVGDEPDAFGDAPVPFVVVSPLAKAGTVTAGAYTHESLLTTIEDGLDVPRLGNTAGAATIADVWR